MAETAKEAPRMALPCPAFDDGASNLTGPSDIDAHDESGLKSAEGRATPGGFRQDRAVDLGRPRDLPPSRLHGPLPPVAPTRQRPPPTGRFQGVSRLGFDERLEFRH